MIACPNAGLGPGPPSVLRGQPRPHPITSLDTFTSWVTPPPTLWVTHSLRLSLCRAQAENGAFGS